MIADAVLKEAVKAAADRRRQELEALARNIGASVANELGRLFSKGL